MKRQNDVEKSRHVLNTVGQCDSSSVGQVSAHRQDVREGGRFQGSHSKRSSVQPKSTGIDFGPISPLLGGRHSRKRRVNFVSFFQSGVHKQIEVDASIIVRQR